tara:strand:- start:213 stop:827 length:615 start_codon:yes stop_codon:yes gene_type:complete
MANSINSISTGSGGLQSIADGTSGNLLIQKDAGTIATFSSTGVVVSGVVAATTLTGDGSALTGISSGGLTEITDFATTSGTTVTSPTLDLSTYKLIYLVCNGIGFTADTGGSFQFTPNGGSICDAFGGFSNANNLFGGWWVDLSNGIGQGTLNIGYPAAAVITGEGAVRTWVNTGLSTSTTSISFTTAGAATFDAGNIKIYGLK